MRLEYKYLVPSDILPILKHKINPFMESEYNFNNPEKKEYSVRSIYFDSRNLDFYHEKLAGLRTRKKLRLRAYNECTGNPCVFLEIKRKSDKYISKNRAPVLWEDIPELFQSGDVGKYIVHRKGMPEGLDDGRRFFFHYFHRLLLPTILITYNREAYCGKFDRFLRITFDRNLRSSLFPDLGDLFSEESMKESAENFSIMEIKFGGGFPVWMTGIISSLNLRKQPFSKYCVCLERHLFPSNMNSFDQYSSRYTKLVKIGRLS
jgi:hypothetical protein